MCRTHPGHTCLGHCMGHRGHLDNPGRTPVPRSHGYIRNQVRLSDQSCRGTHHAHCMNLGTATPRMQSPQRWKNSCISATLGHTPHGGSCMEDWWLWHQDTLHHSSVPPSLHCIHRHPSHRSGHAQHRVCLACQDRPGHTGTPHSHIHIYTTRPRGTNHSHHRHASDHQDSLENSQQHSSLHHMCSVLSCRTLRGHCRVSQHHLGTLHCSRR